MAARLRIRCRIALLTILAVARLLVASAAFGQNMAELEVDHALTFDFVTPHTKWAQPYALGKIRVLFFADGRGTNARECVELMQRFDLDAQAVFWARIINSKTSHWHGGEVGERRMLNLLEQKWDCFIFLGIPITNIPAEQKHRILKAVADGAGIVFVGSDDGGLLEWENRLDPPPPFLATEPAGEAYNVGHGRGMRLRSRPKIDYYEGWHVDYDYWQERLGRTVLWAAGKEPASRLQLRVSPAGSPTEDSTRTISIAMNGRLLGRNPTLHLSIRRPDDDPISWPEEKAPEGSSFIFQLPWLSEGPYHADARIVSSIGIETWETVPFRIDRTRRIAGLKLNQDWGEPERSISGHVELEGDTLPDEIVRIQLLDRRRRELVRKDLDVSSNSSSVPFKFEIAEWLPMLTTVEARLLSHGIENSRAYEYFRVTKRRQRQFNFLIWDFPRGTLAPYAEESLARHGVTLQLGQGNPPPYVAASEISWVPYTTHIRAEKSSEGIMKPFCWNDTEAAANHTSELASKHGGSREHGTFVYSLGDEIATRGSCLSPHCAAAYREYLKQVYGSVKALNTSWGTGFSAWDQVGVSVEYDHVGLSARGDDEELLALKEKNYPRWFDRNAFKSWNFVQYYRKFADAFKALDPSAKTGFEGAGHFANGDDLDLIVRSLDFWTPYSGLADEVVRSIAGRDFIRSNWMGYKKDADSLLRAYWRMVVLGMDSAWWWRWETIGKYHGWLAPDLRPFPAVQEILDDTQIIRDGLGDLLLRSEMQDDAIAIFYSYPSVFACKLDTGPSFGDYEQAHKDILRLVRAQGLQFRYVTDRMLRLGEFDKSRYRLLMLPRAEAIGDKEAEVIRDFVLQGGTVVADLRPGIYDDHCKPRQSGALDDLFGIKRVGREQATMPTMPEGNDQIKIAVDPGTESAGEASGYHIDGTPLFISRNVGNGKAILLNCGVGAIDQLGSILGSAGENGPSFKARTMEAIFAGINASIQLRLPNGDCPDNISITRWRNGDMDIVSLFRETGLNGEIVVTLPRERYVYDLRDRTTLGRRGSFSTTLLVNRASFFVFANEPVSPPTLTLDKDRAEPGTIVKLTISSPNAEGLNACRLRARLEDNSVEWLDRVAVAGQQPLVIDIPFGYNDRQGRYQITATDLFTNESQTAELTLTTQAQAPNINNR